MTSGVQNAVERRAVRVCLILECGWGRIGLFGEPMEQVFFDLQQAPDVFGTGTGGVGPIAWDPAWVDILDAIAALSPFSATFPRDPALFRSLVSVSEIQRDFLADPEANRVTESRFSVTLGPAAAYWLENQLDDSVCEVWEYNESVDDAVLVASGVVLGNSISGDNSRIQFQVVDRGNLYNKADVLDYRVRYEDFQQAPYQSFGDYVPCVYGFVNKMNLILVDEGPVAKLISELPEESAQTLRDISIGTEEVGTFPELGSIGPDPMNPSNDPFRVIVDEEVIGIRSKDAPAGVLKGIRSVASPKHEIGAEVRHFFPELFWAISHFGIKSISNIIAIIEANQIIKLSDEATTEIRQVGNPVVGVVTAGYERDDIVAPLPFSGESSTPAGSDQQIRFYFLSAQTVSGSEIYYRDFQTPPVDHTHDNSQKIVRGEDSTVYLSHDRNYPEEKIVILSNLVAPGTFPQTSGDVFGPIIFNIFVKEGRLSNGLYPWPIEAELSFRTTSGFSRSARTTLDYVDPESHSSYYTEFPNIFSEVSDMSEVSYISVTIVKGIVITPPGSKWELVLSSFESGGVPEQANIKFTYSASVFNDPDNIPDQDQDSYGGLAFPGTQQLPVFARALIKFGQKDIGAMNVRNVALVIRGYIRLSGSSYAKIMFSSFQGPTANITLPQTLGTDTPSISPSDHSIAIGIQAPYDPIFFNQAFFLQGNPSVELEIYSENATDVVRIYQIRFDLTYSRAGYIHSLYSKTIVADIEGVQDSLVQTGQADGSITGSSGALIENPADAIKAIAVLNHSRPLSEISDSFGHARDYYARLSATETFTAASVGSGYLTIAGAPWFVNQWRGYVAKDKNDNTYYIISNDNNRLNFWDQRTPAVGSITIAGTWKFGGAITGEISTPNLLGELQRTFCCRIGEDIESNESKLKILYPLWGVTAAAVARIYGADSEPHASLPSFKMREGLIPFRRSDDPVRKVTVNYRKKYVRASDQSSEWEKVITAESGAATGREITIDARFISDHYTARLLAHTILGLFGARRKVWEIPVIPDAMLVLRWGSIVEVTGSGFTINPAVTQEGRICQVVGLGYTPGEGGTVTVIDTPIFGDGAFTEA